jgi:mono/diheme cytochrome c family protein
MIHSRKLTLAAWLVIVPAACTARSETEDDTGPAPVDTVSPLPTDTTGQPVPVDTAPSPIDTAIVPDTSVATPPITPSSSATPQDTPPAGAPSQKPAPSGGQRGAVSQLEYEGWRQYSVNCARCHGQDVLPNPVAANLLVSLAPGGSMEAKERFVQVVSEGRPDRGMPAFKSIATPAQIEAMYAYVKGRADKRIPPGRPNSPAG